MATIAKPIITGVDYIESLSGRNLRVFLFSERVAEPVDHPMIRGSINAVARTYDLGIEQPGLATAWSSLTNRRVNRFLHVTEAYAIVAAITVDHPGRAYIYGRQSCDTRSMEGSGIGQCNAQFAGQALKQTICHTMSANTTSRASHPRSRDWRKISQAASSLPYHPKRISKTPRLARCSKSIRRAAKASA